MKTSTVIVATFLALNSTVVPAAQQGVIADFEGNLAVAQNFSSHKATTTLVDDTPGGGSEAASKTVVEAKAGARNYFGTGYPTKPMDLSVAEAITFWLKTDIESDFNLQIHSAGGNAMVFRISTIGSAGQWKQFTAPIRKFVKPQWSKGTTDLNKINRWQLTAFGNGPYDGKYVIIDELVIAGSVPAKKEGVVQRGGPIHLKGVQESSTPKTPPNGFRRLFDGKTLNGWNAQARIPVRNYPGAEFRWELKGKALEIAKKNTGRWTIEDGAIVGGQEPPGSGKGAYLVSEEKFGDFELMMDMKPDWKTDSGFLIRTLPGGSPGMQILVDHRPQGGIGGFYGNGIAGIHGMPFAVDARYDKKGNPIGIIAADPKSARVELSKKTYDVLTYAANVEDFLKVWKWGQWNTIKVRCEGRIPKITTWVNGLKIAVLDMNAIEWENYDKEACARMMGRKGHISLEVHDNNFNHWLGNDRWWPGAVVRWKNIFIRELD
ncbi:MAG: hypothetical protein CMO80_05670 [Verrucomicrobiales bacterium]|nr:hypothetical protein [Verrucomicrobiales bacterium]|tara:strand:+ start:430 stop:1899 length:1470 start_codon:yes stop_codon:yes gene_type:complete